MFIQRIAVYHVYLYCSTLVAILMKTARWFSVTAPATLYLPTRFPSARSNCRNFSLIQRWYDIHDAKLNLTCLKLIIIINKVCIIHYYNSVPPFHLGSFPRFFLFNIFRSVYYQRNFGNEFYRYLYSSKLKIENWHFFTYAHNN